MTVKPHSIIADSRSLSLSHMCLKLSAPICLCQSTKATHPHGTHSFVRCDAHCVHAKMSNLSTVGFHVLRALEFSLVLVTI